MTNDRAASRYKNGEKTAKRDLDNGVIITEFVDDMDKFWVMGYKDYVVQTEEFKGSYH